MQTFTDINGRKWTVSITVGTAKRVKAMLGIDMINDMESFLKQIQDIMTRFDVLYVVCQEQADKYGITDEQFACGFAGPVIGEAYHALINAYIAFIPDPEAAARLRVLANKVKVVAEKQIAMIDKKMPQIERIIDEEVAAIVAGIESQIDRDLSTIGKSSITMPESPE